jgi:hypothetical protein
LWWGKEFKTPEPPKQIKAPNFKENIYERTKNLSTSANELDISNDMLKFLVERMRTASEENTLDATEIQSILEKLDSVVKNNDNNIEEIKTNVKPLIDISYQLNYLSTYIKEIETQNNKILEENRNLRDTIDILNDKVYKLNADEQKWYSKLWIGIAILGVIIILLGVIMVKTMPKTGMAHIGGGILLISLALFAQKYAWILAIIGGVGLLVSIGIFIYMVFIHKKAIVENAEATEKLKNKKWSEVKEDFNKIHSKTTKHLFGSAKQDLKKKGKI